MNIEANDLIDVLQQQRNNAMQEAALNGAMAVGLRKRIIELEAQIAEHEKNIKG